MNSAHKWMIAELDGWCLTTAAESLRRLLEDEWDDPEADAAKVREHFAGRFGQEAAGWDLLLTGERENRTVYIQSSHAVYVISPFEPVEASVVLCELSASGQAEDVTRLGDNACRFTPNVSLRERLRLPSVLLVNLTTPHFAHTPSVALGVGMVGAMLRKRQKARVKILDMKLGVSLGEVLRVIRDERPDCVGASIDFGEKTLFIELFESIVEMYEGRECPLLFAGNYLAYLYAEELIERFPRLIVNHSEGEQFALDLVDYRLGKIPARRISAATYRDSETGRLVRTPVTEIGMEDMPLPAPDTLPLVAREKCALTLELSRGCSYNACTFCPRTHKIRVWKGVSARHAVDWMAKAASIFDRHPHLARRIYLVDEEFIGYNRRGAENERLRGFAEGLLERTMKVAFEFNTRVDQIFNRRKDQAWHSERWKALRLCKQAGLKRILLGIESGSETALARFRKGHSVSDSVMALRILSALGIDIRVTFITYDPLMSVDELYENYRYLGRKDALFREFPDGAEDYETLFHRLEDEDYLRAQLTGEPIYQKTCYLHNSMKVLADSQYAHDMREALAGGHLPQTGLVTIKRKNLPVNTLATAVVAAENLSTQYANPALGVAAALGEDWMAKANALTNLLMSPVERDTRERRQTRAQLIARIQHSAFVLLKAVVYVFGGERLSFDELEFDMVTWNRNPDAVNCLVELKREYVGGRIDAMGAEFGVKEIAVETLHEILDEFTQTHCDAGAEDQGARRAQIEEIRAQLLGGERVNPLS